MDHSRRPDPDRPVLVASGFAPFPLPHDLILRRYRRDGFTISVVPFRMEDMRDTRAFAEHVAAEARQIAEAYEGKIDLVGVSMGGIAGLHAIKRLGIAPFIKTFVAVGTPFQGTSMAVFGLPTGVFSRVGRQLSPWSKYLSELHGDPLPRGPRYVSIIGEQDVICPPPTARLDGAENLYGPFGHASLFYDSALHDLVAAVLRGKR
jgi:triacylglycerol lipase